MSAQKILIFADLPHRRMTDANGGALTLPTLYAGEKYTFKFQLLDFNTAGTLVPVDKNIRSISASLGVVQQPPVSGKFTLRFDADAPSAEIDIREPPDSLRTKLAALTGATTYGLQEVYAAGKSCWMARFTAAGTIPLNIGDNMIEPVTFIRVRQLVQNGRTWLEIRLLQAPIASTTNFAVSSADLPSIREIRQGGQAQFGLDLYIFNEIQALDIPQKFQGTLELVFQGRKSGIISNLSTPAQIQSALEGMFGTTGVTHFAVTNPEVGSAYIEFVGPLRGTAFALMTINILSVKDVGNEFDLDLNTVEAEASLRQADTGTISMLFELWAGIAAIGDITSSGDRFTLFRETIQVARSLQWDGLTTATPVNWLQPPQTSTMRPFTPDQVITGTQYFEQTMGDGAATIFVIPHNLATEAVMVAVRENHDGGRLLRDNEYAVTIINENSLSIEILAGAPDADSLAVLVASAGPRSAFEAHTHTIDDILTLQTQLDELQQNIAALQGLLPVFVTGQGGVTADVHQALVSFTIPSFADLFPAKVPTTFKPGDPITDFTVLRAGALLPAIHKDTLDDSALAALPSLTSGGLYQAAGDIVLPGGLAIPGETVKNGDFIGCDGRLFYRVIQAGATNSYYPAVMERTLLTLFVNDAMLRTGFQFALGFQLQAELIKSDSKVECAIVVEIGAVPQDTAPSPVDLNLQNVAWNVTTPALKQRIIIGEAMTTHQFGLQIFNLLTGMQANKSIYGGISAADIVPADANFGVRARAVEFDTENDVLDPEGMVHLVLTSPAAAIT